MSDFDETHVEFFVKKDEKTKSSVWELMLRNADKEGSASWIIQRWKRKPKQDAVNAAVHAATKAMTFLTVQLNIAEPRLMRICVPKMRVRVKGG